MVIGEGHQRDERERSGIVTCVYKLIRIKNSKLFMIAGFVVNGYDELVPRSVEKNQEMILVLSHTIMLSLHNPICKSNREICWSNIRKYENNKINYNNNNHKNHKLNII